MTTTVPSSILDRLAADLDGALIRPDDAGWDAARQAWQLATDQRPVAVVFAESVRDVVAVVDAARQYDLRVAAQATGHNADPLVLAGTILLKTARLRSVAIDPIGRVARVEAGALWADVTAAAAEFGLTALAGSAADVGVAGYTLGGGLSWLARSHGLAANSVVALDVVTADGAVRRVDADHDSDLFWALRGGGGSFAIVTGFEFRLYPITEVCAGVLFFPLARAADVLAAWREWLPSVPDQVTSVGRLLRFPPLPDLPPHLSGQSYAVVELASQLTRAETDALVAPLRALGPVLDTIAVTPTAGLAGLHMDPDGPVPAYGDGMLLGELTSAGLESFLRAAGPTSRTTLLSVELRQLGGALTPGRMAGGVVDSIAADFALFAVGITPDAATRAAARDSVDAVQHAMAPWSTGGAYLNFAERPKSGPALFGAANYARLQHIKASYDPADLIRSNHPVPPAPGC